MLRWLKTTNPHDATATALYGAIVEQARVPSFYATLGVPDTIEGRFELVALHMAMVVDRLALDGPEGLELGRALNEVFVTDMDDNMREIGVGDMAVPRKVKKAAAAVYDRARSLRAALAEGDNKALEAVLALNVHLQGSTTQQSQAEDGDLERLARYVRQATTALAAQAVSRGKVAFPDPLSIS